PPVRHHGAAPDATEKSALPSPEPGRVEVPWQPDVHVPPMVQGVGDEPAFDAERARRRARRWIVGIFVLSASAVVFAILYFVGVVGQTEEARFQAALADYQAGKYASARKQFDDLGRKFPSSERAPTYQFLAGLSGVRDRAYSIPANPRQAL